MTSILDTGKDGYDCDAEFDARTAAAVNGEHSAWGDPEKLLHDDAKEVLSFVQGDYQVVAPLLAKLKSYRILDLGCGYGRLAPFLSAFDCDRYCGVERVAERVAIASRQSSRIVSFASRDILSSPGAIGWPHSADWPLGMWAGSWNVVWTSNVLQHFTVPDKLRLVETMKACRAPGGVCLLREAEVMPISREACEKRYASKDQPKHMIPIPYEELRLAFEPLRFRQLGGMVWIAEEQP